MGLIRFRLAGVRNLETQELSPGPGLNLLTGANGSGKTSLLEAVFVLGRGKSFRTSRMAEVIRRGESSLEVFGEVGGGADGGPIDRIGVRKERASTEIRVNGEWEARLSSLVRRFPLVVVTPRSHELLERGPEERRRMIDWGVFHVEPGYHELMTRYQKILSQRNEGLRRQPALVRVWDPELSRVAEEIEARRSSFIQRLIPYLTEALTALLPEHPIGLEWRRGWSAGREIREVLLEDLANDQRQGFTRQGPHRADILFSTGEVGSAAGTLSRGQAKLLLIAVFVGQANLFRDLGHRPPTLLVDDLGSELDRAHRGRAIDLLRASRLQVIITEKELYSGGTVDSDLQMFHVEQGRITPS